MVYLRRPSPNREVYLHTFGKTADCRHVLLDRKNTQKTQTVIDGTEAERGEETPPRSFITKLPLLQSSPRPPSLIKKPP